VRDAAASVHAQARARRGGRWRAAAAADIDRTADQDDISRATEPQPGTAAAVASKRLRRTADENVTADLIGAEPHVEVPVVELDHDRLPQRRGAPAERHAGAGVRGARAHPQAARDHHQEYRHPCGH